MYDEEHTTTTACSASTLSPFIALPEPELFLILLRLLFCLLDNSPNPVNVRLRVLDDHVATVYHVQHALVVAVVRLWPGVWFQFWLSLAFAFLAGSRGLIVLECS